MHRSSGGSGNNSDINYLQTMGLIKMQRICNPVFTGLGLDEWEHIYSNCEMNHDAIKTDLVVN